MVLLKNLLKDYCYVMLQDGLVQNCSAIFAMSTNFFKLVL